MADTVYMHQSGLPAINVNGVERVLGCIPGKSLFQFARFADKVPVMPRSEWRDIDRRKSLPFILDQKSHGSCVGFSAAGALMRARALSGQNLVTLSGAFVYSFINGGRDQGAMIGDAVSVLENNGVATDYLVPWDHIFPSRIDKRAYEVAKRFRAEAIYVANTFDEIMTAIQLGEYIPVFAVMVGNRFTSLDRDGICGFDNGPGNHAVHADGAKKIGSDWTIDMPNSWNLDFGVNGRGRLTERHIESVQQDCYVIKAAIDDPEDPDPPVATE